MPENTQKERAWAHTALYAKCTHKQELAHSSDSKQWGSQLWHVMKTRMTKSWSSVHNTKCGQLSQETSAESEQTIQQAADELACRGPQIPCVVAPKPSWRVDKVFGWAHYNRSPQTDPRNRLKKERGVQLLFEEKMTTKTSESISRLSRLSTWPKILHVDG